MKKLSVILASLVLFAGISFANPVVKQTQPATDKKTAKKADKKVPAKKGSKKADKKADAPTTPAK